MVHNCILVLEEPTFMWRVPARYATMVFVQMVRKGTKLADQTLFRFMYFSILKKTNQEVFKLWFSIHLHTVIHRGSP